MLDLNKLQNAHERGGKTVARCPACAEAGGDRKGEHLFLKADGRFGCVQFPGVDGQAHRKRIFELVGIPNQKERCVASGRNLADARSSYHELPAETPDAGDSPRLLPQ